MCSSFIYALMLMLVPMFMIVGMSSENQPHFSGVFSGFQAGSPVYFQQRSKSTIKSCAPAITSCPLPLPNKQDKLDYNQVYKQAIFMCQCIWAK